MPFRVQGAAGITEQEPYVYEPESESFEQNLVWLMQELPYGTVPAAYAVVD